MGNLHGGIFGGALTDDELTQRGRLQAPPEDALLTSPGHHQGWGMEED